MLRWEFKNIDLTTQCMCIKTPGHSMIQKQYSIVFKLYEGKLKTKCNLIRNNFHTS